MRQLICVPVCISVFVCVYVSLCVVHVYSDSYIVLRGIGMYCFPVAWVFLCPSIPRMVRGEDASSPEA